MKSPDVKNEIKGRAGTIRARTWTLTLAIIISIVLYFLVKIVTNDNIDLVGFIITCVLQIVVHCLYFPEGELFGQKNESFIANKNAYNEKAGSITRDKKISSLRNYCKFEYEKRREEYILTECGAIGITIKELAALRQMSEKEIKSLEKFQTDEGMIYFTKRKRKRLHALIFKPLPIEENFPETIMSAVENRRDKSIKDGSISYKAQSYIRKILIAVVIGLVCAYIGYSLREGIGFAQIVSIIVYLTTIFTSSVLAFSSGETCQKVHKSRYYLALSNFIDGFLEWEKEENPPKTGENG